MANERILSETGGIKVVIYRTPNKAARPAVLNFCGAAPESAGLMLASKSGLSIPPAHVVNRVEAAVVAFVDDGDGKKIAIDAWISPAQAGNPAVNGVSTRASLTS